MTLSSQPLPRYFMRPYRGKITPRTPSCPQSTQAQSLLQPFVLSCFSQPPKPLHPSSAFISAAVSALQTARISVVTSHPDCQKAVLANPTASNLVPLPTGPPLKAYNFALPVTRMPSPGCLCKTMPTSPCKGNGSTLTLERLTFNHLRKTSPGVLEDLPRINPHNSDSCHLQAQRQPLLWPLTTQPQPHPDSDWSWQKHHKHKLHHYFNTLAQHPLSSNRKLPRSSRITSSASASFSFVHLKNPRLNGHTSVAVPAKSLATPAKHPEPKESKSLSVHVGIHPARDVGPEHVHQRPRGGQPSSAREMWVVSLPPALLQEIPLSLTFNKFSSIRTRKALEEELGLSAGDAEAVKRRTSTSKTTAATQSCTNSPTHPQPLCLTAPQTPLPNNSPAPVSALVVPANLAHSPTIIHFPAPSSVHPMLRPGKGNPSPHCKRHNV
ncbi:hypothetical protein PTTG_07001, partial [Puccinia triticina 1-1 BBBD Race 1]